jgi:pimeloyl-ACP methyl ester carboxylesterase
MRLILVLIIALPAFCCDKTRAPQFWFTLPDGDRINYEEHGTGKRDVVALHGFAASLDTWRDILPFLEADFHLYLIDMKGFGLSSDVKIHKYSVFDQAEIVASFVEKLDLHEVVLMGHSFGGAVAMMTYVRLKDEGAASRVSGIVLLDALGFRQNLRLPSVLRILRVPVLNRFVLNLVPRRRQAANVLKHVIHDRTKMTPERICRYAQFYDLPGAHRAIIGTVRQFDANQGRLLSKRIREVDAPTLIVWGKFDKLIPPSEAEALRRAIAKSEEPKMLNCGHIPQEEVPEETARLIRGFAKHTFSKLDFSAVAAARSAP